MVISITDGHLMTNTDGTEAEVTDHLVLCVAFKVKNCS